MPLRDSDKRQIAQFILIAEGYLKLGASASSITSETLGMKKRDFLPSASITSRTRELTMIGAPGFSRDPVELY